MVYSPGDVTRLPVAAGDLTSGTLATWLPVNLLTPLDLIHALLPGMLERGAGGIVVAQGSAVREPTGPLASSSVAQAGLLNYLLAVNTQIRPRGVYAASLQIGRLIERSAAARLFAEGHFADVESGPIPTADPDHFVDMVWRPGSQQDTRSEVSV